MPLERLDWQEKRRWRNKWLLRFVHWNTNPWRTLASFLSAFFYSPYVTHQSMFFSVCPWTSCHVHADMFLSCLLSLFSSPTRHFVGTWTCPSLLKKPLLFLFLFFHTKGRTVQPLGPWPSDHPGTLLPVYLFISLINSRPCHHMCTHLPHPPSDRKQTTQTQSRRNPSGLIDHNNQNRPIEHTIKRPARRTAF